MPSPTEVISPVTIANYVKGRWNNILKMNPFFGMLEKKGNIKTGESGTMLNWAVRAGIYQAIIASDYQDLSSNYVPKKQYFQATLPWGEIVQTDAVSKGEFAKNDGEQVLVRLRDYRVPDMVSDLINRSTTSLAYQILNQNGSTYAGSGDPMYGFPSGMTDAGGTASSANFAVASGTYAGQSIALNGISVDGAVDNAWTPTLVNTTSSGWGAGASAKNNVLEYLTAGQLAATFDAADSSEKPTMGILNQTYFGYLQNALTAKETIFIQQPVEADDIWGIGTSVVMARHNGLSYCWDSNMSTFVGYQLNLEKAWMHFLKVPAAISADRMPGPAAGRKDIFDTEVNYNDQRRGVTVSITGRGQLRFSPRHQVGFKAYA